MIKSRFSSMLVATAVLLTGLASCNDENDPVVIDGTIDDGEPTTLTLSLSQPKTYATTLETANDYEAALEWVDVFIYNPAGVLVKSERILKGQFSPGSSDQTKEVWKGDASIVTTTGPKVVYAGVNLPTNIVNNIKASGVSVINDITLSDLVITQGLAMFSIEPESINLTDNVATNVVDIPVSRLVAKVAVKAGENLNLGVTGGTLSNLEFAMRNSNTQIYALPQMSGANYIDPNWSWTNFQSSWFEDLDTYVAINTYSAVNDYKNMTAKYVPENTTEKYLEKETTYAAIKANFLPSKITVANGDGYKTEDNSTSGTFYTVSAGSGNTAYFLNKTVAEKYATDNALDPTDDVVTYTDGLCYYNLFLNPTKKFDVDRNTYYVATITEIIGLGSNKDDETDPELPVKESTTMKFNIEIIDWVVQEDDYVLVP